MPLLVFGAKLTGFNDPPSMRTYRSDIGDKLSRLTTEELAQIVRARPGSGKIALLDALIAQKSAPALSKSRDV